MRTVCSLLLSAAVLGAGLSAAPAAGAGDLSRARAERRAAEAAVAEARGRLDRVLAEYRRVQDRLARAAADVVAAYAAQDQLAERLAEAQASIDRRAAEAYEAGPAVAIEMFLGSATPADFASAQEFAARTFAVDDATVAAVADLKASIDRLTQRRERRQLELAADEAQLEALAAEARQSLREALGRARRAGLELRRLEREARALREAERATRSSLEAVVDPSRGVDQSALLALLGPTGGRTCRTPSRLRDTGRRVEGLSSWYGWEFAGQATASGAIFDPRLFTVANKELPLGVFLRFHYDGRCALALLNDRGPYGGGRSFDVSMAVADYLGFRGAGVAYVSADVLVPK